MFRFTIRDVLWLTAVIALAIGWLAENRHMRRRAHIQAIQLELLKDTLEKNSFEVELKPDGASTKLRQHAQ
jgi:hypothetical protein